MTTLVVATTQGFGVVGESLICSVEQAVVVCSIGQDLFKDRGTTFNDDCMMRRQVDAVLIS
jgi:hypothetical protein